MDRSTLGGCGMMFAFLLLGMGLWELLVDGSGEGWDALIAGAFFLVTGFFVASWDVWGGDSSSGVIDPVEVEGNLGEINAREKAEAEAAALAASPPPQARAEKRFTIHQTGDDTAVDEAANILAGVKQITSIHAESGRWYSVPDGDDLPEWNALRIYCEVEDLDAFMDEMRALLRARMSSSDYNELTIAHY
ncbi:hypothetical protein [Parerythrobacter aestuarii]|uniref:hypothetical protein n=1 Tax=Parerythrobacter aestuarii TaxID=3020909 RepID=UPI0024DEB00B|nr:hypothetical protein [Parerythrobacter aestuarii]